ncbi:myelocytomatosis oncogene homolog [Eucyclogobius newberryi]|uniref:myelocytomatosis oncogene homolog n=1 Tax=Eucyclogobius newberryi TaxID=166745 RepID=UPI003B5CD9F1
MLQSFSQSQDWLYSEPLFDDDFYQNLVKNLESLPTPPQSPPMKPSDTSDSKPLSKEDQLSYVSNILLEDCDMQALDWSCDMFELKEVSPTSAQLEDGTEYFLWKELGKGFDEKLVSSMLSSSPLLSDIDTSIFEGIAGSTLDCQALMENTPEGSEETSDYGSTGGELSNYSSSDSEEEIDVVTVRCTSGQSSPLPSLADIRQREQEEAEKRRLTLQRHNAEIQQQHNYAAPCPPSPPPSHGHKRSRDSSARHHAHRNSSTPVATSRFSPRNSTEMEDDEERRRTHNVMERQRRNELKNCFMHLRDNVPELTRNEKASKVVILKKARDCIFNLEDDAHRLQKKRDQLRARQEELKARISLLRS